MKRRTAVGLIGGAVLLGGGGYVGVELFAPERATRVNEAGTSEEGAEVLKRGEFVGKANHECSGTVELARDSAGLFLGFRDYEQTQGPDVFCYLTPAADPDTAEEIGAGTRVRIDGGADGGELTKTGTFVQRLSGIDPEVTNGVGVWCDRFAVPFGAATLSSGDASA